MLENMFLVMNILSKSLSVVLSRHIVPTLVMDFLTENLIHQFFLWKFYLSVTDRTDSFFPQYPLVISIK